MTGILGDSVGRIEAEGRIDTSKMPDDMEDGLDRAGRRAERQSKQTGKDIGEPLGKAIGDELERQGPHLARSVHDGLEANMQPVKVAVAYDREGNVAKRWVTFAARDLKNAVDKEAGPGGAFSALSGSIGAAIGAGFNVSGRSPLILLLIPVLGAIAELIGGLIQAVSGLTALLYLIPSLLGAIVLQVGVAFLAFKGLGTAIQGAFAAKNASELNEAIKDLTPSAQKFVKALLPLRDFFNTFSKIAQEGFFSGIAGGVENLIKFLNSIPQGAIQSIAFELGNVAKTLLNVFNNVTFKRFFTGLLDSTTLWLRGFAVAIDNLTVGLSNLGYVMKPFFDWFGNAFNNMLTDLGYWLTSLSYDPEFIKFLEDAKTTLGLLGDSLLAILKMLKEFSQALTEAGGDKFLEDIKYAADSLGKFFDSDMGVKGLEGLIHTIQVLAFVFLALLLGTLQAFALLELTLEFIRHGIIPAIGEFFGAIGKFFSDLIRDIGNLFTVDIPKHVDTFVTHTQNAIMGLGTTVLNALETGWNNAVAFIRGLPRRAEDAIRSLGSTLVQAGRNLINGLMDGMRERLGPLGNLMGFIGGIIADHLPHSPAELGPLSGRGDPLYSGQKIVERLALGMAMEAPALNAATNQVMGNIVFGPGSVSVGFNGALPTSQQAFQTGQAAGNGIASVLAQRNTRLAIRSMGTAT
jgi:hypothetical protein